MAGGIVEVAEANFQVFADGFMDAVGILDHTIVHAPHAVGNMVLSGKAFDCILARKSFQLGGDFSCLFSCDELGRLNTIHQKPKFVRLKGRVQKSVLGVTFRVSIFLLHSENPRCVDQTHRGFSGKREVRK